MQRRFFCVDRAYILAKQELCLAQKLNCCRQRIIVFRLLETFSRNFSRWNLVKLFGEFSFTGLAR